MGQSAALEIHCKSCGSGGTYKVTDRYPKKYCPRCGNDNLEYRV